MIPFLCIICRSIMNFITEVIGELKYAPNLKIQVACTHFVKGREKIFSIDVRKYYKVGRDTWTVTRSGVSMARSVAMDLHNAIVAIPDAIDLKGQEYLKLWSEKKTEAIDLYLGIGKLNAFFGLDVREFVHDDAHHYHGFSQKGFRIPVECSADLAELILQAINRVDDETSKKAPYKARQEAHCLKRAAYEDGRGEGSYPKALFRKPKQKRK